MGFVPLSPAMVRLPLLTLADYRAFFAAPETGLAERLWAHSRLREAVRVANPELADSVGRTTGSRRLRAALANYAIRAATRPTPFGLFGGVGFADWGSGRPLRVVDERTVSRPGPGVLDEAVRDADPAALVVGHNPTLRRGAHRVEAVVGTVADAGARVSVRRTAVLDLALDLTTSPTTGAALLAGLGARHPDVPEARLRAYVRDLVAKGVLVARLPAEPDLGPVRDLLAEYDRTPIGSGEAVLAEVRTALGGARRGDVSTDVALTLEGVLPAALAVRLARAADVLQTVARTVPGSPALAAYARAFEGRFGAEEVPVTDLLDPVRGLGPPPGYRGGPPAPGDAAHLTSLRRGLIERAVAGVVELTWDEVRALPPPVRDAVPSCDLFVLVGRPVGDEPVPVIAPRGFAFPAGRASSRFAHLDPRVAEHVRAAAGPERAANPDVLFADVDYRYPDPAYGDLVVGVPPHPARIRVTGLADTAAESLTLSDIVVGVHRGSFYLRSAVDGRRVVARSHHLLSLREGPNAVRFLREVSDDRIAVPGWSWGGFADTHHALPRVCVGGVVVAPARWRVPEPGDGLARWRERWGVPRFVHIGHEDNRLLLDLDVAAHREEFAARVRHGATHVEEAPHATRDGVAEIVVSLANPAPPVFGALPDRGAPVVVRTRQPGDGWWSLHLYGPRESQDEVLVALRVALAALGAEWFFVRYNVPTDHLRVRVRAGTAPLEDLLAVARRLHDRELVGRVAVEPYQADVQRLGGVEGLARAEELFCRETPPVVDALARPASTDVDEVGVGCLFAAGYLAALGVADAVVEEVLRRTAADATPPRGRERAAEHAQRRLLVDVLTGRSRPEGLSAAVAAIGERVPERRDIGPDLARTLLHLHVNRLGYDRATEARIGARLLGTRHGAAVRRREGS